VESSIQPPSQPIGRVLVVEDTPDIRELLGEILSFEGYDVATANDGAEALNRLVDDHSFDLVLTDLMMPKMHGLDLIAHLAKWVAHPPVIAMSAFERFRDEARALGAAGFLPKPVDIDVLLREVRRVIDLHAHP
jgi:CheY-like chemotaxis protein